MFCEASETRNTTASATLRALVTRRSAISCTYSSRTCSGVPPRLRLLAAELLHPWAVHDPRVQRVDIDVVGPDLERYRAREPAQRPLRRRVRRAQLVAAQPRGAADVHDLAVALGDHRRQHVLDGQE